MRLVLKMEAVVGVRLQELVVLEQVMLVVEARVQKVCERRAVALVASCQLEAAVLASCLYSMLRRTVSSP